MIVIIIIIIIIIISVSSSTLPTMQPTHVVIEDAESTIIISWLQSVMGIFASVYKEMEKEIMEKAKRILKTVLGLAQVMTTEVQPIDDADWVLFGETCAKWIKSQESQVTKKKQIPQGRVKSSTKLHQEHT